MTVAILGVMAGIAVPNFGSLMSNSQLKSTYNTFAGVIATARVEAVNRRAPIIVCPSSNGSTCLTGAKPDWSAGYLAYADANGNSTVEAAEILRYETVHAGLSITSADYPQSITIAARGRLRTEGTFVFCKGDNDKSAKALNLWVTGLGRLATDTDGDQIVEGADGEEVSCSEEDEDD